MAEVAQVLQAALETALSAKWKELETEEYAAFDAGEAFKLWPRWYAFLAERGLVSSFRGACNWHREYGILQMLDGLVDCINRSDEVVLVDDPACTNGVGVLVFDRATVRQGPPAASEGPKFSEHGIPILSLSLKLAALVTCISGVDYEDAAGHLCDLLLYVGGKIEPSVGPKRETLEELVAFYGQHPAPIED